MPKSVYSVQVRGRDLGGNYRCETETEAQSIYDALKAGVHGSEEFFELELQGQKVHVRKANISGFVLAVHMEETPEERKARAIAQIEQHGENYNQAYADCGPKTIGYGGII